MNKRQIAFLPILSLFLSLPLTPVNAAVKVGGTCSKAGITSVAASKTYTCIKSGKKFVWNKGVAVVKPTQIIPVNADVKLGALCTKAGIKAVASGTTYECILVESMESTSKGVEKSLGWFLRWMEEATPTCDPPVKKEVAPTPVKKKAEPLPRIAPIKSADYPLVGALAKNTILNQKANVHNPFVIYWSPTTTELKRKFYSEQIEIMKKYFSPMIPNDSKAHIYILGSDKEWACEVFKKAPDVLMISKMYQVSSKCATTPQGALILDAVSGADYTNYRGAGGGLSVLGTGYGMVALSNCDLKYLDPDILIHETFHAIQWIYTSFKLDSEAAVKLPKVTGPLWMVEGSATYMGYLLSADGVWTSYGEDKRGFILGNSGGWKKSYEEFNASGEDYSIGAVMYEYMLAKYGLERTLSFWPEAINRLSTKDLTNDLARRAASTEAFKTVFGLSVEDFLNEVKPYIEWSLEQANRA